MAFVQRSAMWARRQTFSPPVVLCEQVAAAASGEYGSVQEAMAGMSHLQLAVDGTAGPAAVREYHSKKYAVFRRMADDQRVYRDLMQ